jgi:hypothetical protein
MSCAPETSTRRPVQGADDPHRCLTLGELCEQQTARIAAVRELAPGHYALRVAMRNLAALLSAGNRG